MEQFAVGNYNDKPVLVLSDDDRKNIYILKDLVEFCGVGRKKK